MFSLTFSLQELEVLLGHLGSIELSLLDSWLEDFLLIQVVSILNELFTELAKVGQLVLRLLKRDNLLDLTLQLLLIVEVKLLQELSDHVRHQVVCVLPLDVVSLFCVLSIISLVVVLLAT